MSDPVETVEKRLDQLLQTLDAARCPMVEFRRLQFDLGLAWVHFPEGRGGLNLPPYLQSRINARLRDAGAPSPESRHFFGLTMAGPTIVTNGSESRAEATHRRRMP
jgi:alkylation response protein AidB-like acyl-CoA dehydrogenase